MTTLKEQMSSISLLTVGSIVEYAGTILKPEKPFHSLIQSRLPPPTSKNWIFAAKSIKLLKPARASKRLLQRALKRKFNSLIKGCGWSNVVAVEHSNDKGLLLNSKEWYRRLKCLPISYIKPLQLFWHWSDWLEISLSLLIYLRLFEEVPLQMHGSYCKNFCMSGR